MSAQDSFLTDIYDGIQAVYFFLSGDLSREKLSRDSELKRSKYSQLLEGLLNKIQLHQPAAHHDEGTNSNSSKPPPPIPPPSSDTPPQPAPSDTLIPDHEPTDYLDFEPAPLDGSEPQEMYEAMENIQDVEQDLYEEAQGGDDPSEVYEEPVASRPSTANGSLPGMTPPGSRENSGSGVEYMEANRSRVQEPDAALEWSSVYQLPTTSSRLKVSQLKNITIKGPLEKLGGKSHRTWQKRYCVLSGPLMYFYEKETSKTFNNFISVSSFSVEYSENLSDKKHFAFKLTQLDFSGKKKDYCFRSTSSENRDKWVTCMKKVIGVTQGEKVRPGAATLPRMPSKPQGDTAPIHVPEKRRSLTIGGHDDTQEPEEPQELYEPVDNVTGRGGEEEEEEGQDDYVAVSPDAIRDDFESSEEYIDVQPHGDEPTEVYEEPPIMLNGDAPPPPPTSPPPGPPKDHPFPPPSPSPEPPAMPPKQPVIPPRPSPSIGKKPPPLPPEPQIDTSIVYVQSTNGIDLHKVFVSLWDFPAGEKDELNLKRGNLVLVKDPQPNADWWFGELLDDEATSKLGKSGFFPRTYASHAFEAINA